MIEVAREFMPDVALLEIGLPVMDGYELAGRLRALFAHRHIRFIAITGYGQAIDRRRSLTFSLDLAARHLHEVTPKPFCKEVEMPNQMKDRMASTAKEGRAPMGHGLVGVFQTLADQHDAIAALFAQLMASPDSRAMLWPQIRRELVSHEHSEVRELFPVLRQLEEIRALADHHDEEARQLDAMIAQLDTLDIQSHKWIQYFAQLVETVTHHAKEEEEAKVFPIAQRALGEARAIELDAKVRVAKQQVSEGN